MITIFTGTPGSGKSLHTAHLIYKWINIYNQPVICNFEIDTKLLKKNRKGGFLYLPNPCITPDILKDFSKQYSEKVLHGKRPKEDSILLVIDESQLMFNSREWMKSGRSDWIAFFTLHRKLGYRIVLSCQSATMLDKQIRENCEFEFIHRKLKNMGLHGKIVNILKGGKTCISLKMYSAKKEVIEREYIKIRPKYYMMYDTNKLFS